MQHTAIYVRQSVERADSVSLETQAELCRKDLAPEEPVEIYSDCGFSGKNTERPALRAMLAAVRADAVRRVLVYKLDRISRNLSDFTQLLQIFAEHHVIFESHTERFETGSPMGQAMQSLLMVFAQLERETISGRVRDAVFARARAGFDTGGAAPFGFRKTPCELLGRRTQMLIPDENASAVMEGFSAYLRANGSLTSVCTDWNAQGIRTVRGGMWSANTLCRVLRNPVYVQADARVYAYLSAQGAELCVPEQLPECRGVYLYTDRRQNRSRFTDLHGSFAVCAPHTGLVPAELWLACQQKLEASRRKRTAGKGRRSFLSGLIFCGNCGSAMTVVRGRHADYLQCSGRKHGRCCGAGAVWRVQQAEALVGAAISACLERYRSGQIPVRDMQPEPSAVQELSALTLRREQLLQQIMTAPAEAIPVLTDAAARIEMRCRRLTAAVRPRHSAVKVPEWQACDTETCRTIAGIILHCVIVNGEQLHAFLN